MAKLTKAEIIEKLVAADIDHDPDDKVAVLLALLPAEEQPEEKVVPLEVPEVPLGRGTIQDHEYRLCVLERKLGTK